MSCSPSAQTVLARTDGLWVREKALQASLVRPRVLARGQQCSLSLGWGQEMNQKPGSHNLLRKTDRKRAQKCVTSVYIPTIFYS